ncbi:MAG: peptidoglycan-binding protein [Faecousia sp.]
MSEKQKQCLLAYLGYYTGAMDGAFGSKSRAATEAFQRDYDLTPDGVFGPLTQARILEVIASGETPENTAQAAEGPDWWDEIRYFKREEKGIACPCGRCGGFPVEPAEKLMRLADRVREAAGAPMCPSSTVRCQAHNDELSGSVKNSRHLSGKAMDFCIRGWGAARTLALVRQQPEVRYAYAIDGSYVHMDVE